MGPTAAVPELSVPVEQTVWHHWCRHAAHEPEREAIVHYEASGEPVRWTRGALIAAARSVARQLAGAGIRPGEVCGLIVRHHPHFYPIYLGVCALGALPAVLPYPNARLHPEKFRSGIEGMARKSGLDWILTERELEAMLSPLVAGAGSSVRGLHFPLDWPLAGDGSQDTVPTAYPTTCLVQHSSGTTGLQKAIALSHRAVLDHVAHYADAVHLRAEDRIVSWLPLYHDMGLIAAFYLALTTGTPLVQMSPFEWVVAPSLLLSALASERGTLCWLPNFAYNHMVASIHDEDLEGVRLDGVRLFVNCSEMVRAESHRAFAHRFAPLGLRADALGACYAMAETTFAVTQTPPGQPARELLVDRAELAAGRVALAASPEQGRLCTSSGQPIRGCEVRVVDESGEPLPAGRVGELIIRSESMFEGYRNDPATTARALRDGWYWSGDFGFTFEGEWYVVGRKKDLIIVAGRNLYPEDIEATVSGVPGVSPGRVVAVGIEDALKGTEEIWVITETEVEDPAQQRQLRQAITEAVMQIDVTVARVCLAPPRWLIKSSSGKPSRQANKERALRELAQP
jgi:acyl-CoA synthetase (AMP-forming)/AMP-acid ligase II